MQIHTETKKLGEVVHTHKVCEGTYYHRDTSDEVIRALERARVSGKRVRIFCGDVVTGKAWQEENDIMGTMGRSGGTFKVPLLIANKRSLGGPHILDHCIVAIRYTGKGRKPWLYKHPDFTTGIWTVCERTSGAWSVGNDGQEFARETTEDKAIKLAYFMKGWRDSK